MTTTTGFDNSFALDLAAPTSTLFEDIIFSQLPQAGSEGSEANTELRRVGHHGASDFSNVSLISRISDLSAEPGSDYFKCPLDIDEQGKNIQSAAGAFILAGALAGISGLGAAAMASVACGMFFIKEGRRTEPSSLPRAITTRLRQLANLPSNWNSYGASQIDAGALAEAKRIIEIACGWSGLGLPTPTVSPGSHGGLGIEWSTDQGIELVLDIPPRDAATYVLAMPNASGDELVTEDYVGTEDNLAYLLRHIIE